MGYSLVNKTTRYDEAEKYLDHALKLQPDEPVIIDSYGWLLFKRGQPEKALEYLRKAYVRLPENEIVAHLAEVLWTLGNEKDARELFDNAYKKSPDDEYLLEFRNRFYHDGQK
jgi:tetratricopeptide (TPR) repeat protein